MPSTLENQQGADGLELIVRETVVEKMAMSSLENLLGLQFLRTMKS